MRISSAFPPAHRSRLRPDFPKEKINTLIQSIIHPASKSVRGTVPQHAAPATFQRNQPLALQLQTDADSVRLCYRHVNEGERYVSVEMEKVGNAFYATIPAAYTDSEFFLQYYFEIARSSGAMMLPGFEEHFMGVPYFVVIQA